MSVLRINRLAGNLNHRHQIRFSRKNMSIPAVNVIPEIVFPSMPESGCQVSLRYVVSTGQLAFLEKTGIVLPGSLATAVLKRKVEFAAGRFCAAQALQKQGYRGQETLGIGLHRAPVWPDGYLGSISHADGLAVAVVTASRDWGGVGIDIERILDNEAAQPLVPYLMTTTELAIGTTTGLLLEHWLTLIFSAKESLFKALYPYVGRYFDFLDAEVCEFQEDQACVVLRLVTTLSPRCIKGSRYCIRYSYFDRNLATLCLLPVGIEIFP